jgi:lysozyme
MRVNLPYFVAVMALLGLSPLTSLAQIRATAPVHSVGANPPGTSAAALGLTNLTNDLSRKDLFVYIRNAADASDDPKKSNDEVQFFNLYGTFRFPIDAQIDVTKKGQPREDSIFGVDISHHNSAAFPIEQLSMREVRFVYMKATQGTRFLDPVFANFWLRAGSLPKGSQVHRGAYHFLTSGDPKVAAADWGRAQAETFVKVIKANGGLLPTDMPPVVDVEWDKATKNGPDRWKNREPGQIIAMVNAYITHVKAELKRTPMIYTAQSWWRERIGSESQFSALSGYPLWIADYSRTSRAVEIPKTINGAPWVLWQYTDGAEMMNGFNRPFDSNIFKGKNSAFYGANAPLGVQEFQ